MKLPIGFKTIGPKPYEYQKETIYYGITHENAGLLLQMGLGKTRCAIDIARYRMQFGDVKNVLVVVPTSILYNWQKEIEKFSEYNSIILHSEIRENRIELIKRSKYIFNIINYEGLQPFIKELYDKEYDMIIFDESSRYIKNHATHRTRAAVALSDRAKHKLILTGTLIANTPLDLFSQFRVLDGGKTFGLNFWAFRNGLFVKVDTGKFSKFYLRADKREFITNSIYKSCIRKTKEECLPDLPNKIYHTIPILLDINGAQEYDSLQSRIISDIETEMGTKRFEINNILTKLLRLQQFTSGFIKDVDIKETKLTRTPKLDTILDEIDSIVDADEAVVVWCRFLFSIDMISEGLKKLKINYLTMSGRDKDKYSKWKTYQQSKDIKVFIAQVQSGGIGIELFKEGSSASKTQHNIFYENTWSLDVREQAMGRIHRIGQRSVCRYVDIIIENTIDERILDTIKGNKQIAEEIYKRGIRGFLQK